jgi:hypothetical protein
MEEAMKIKNIIIILIFLFCLFLPCCLFLVYADTKNDKDSIVLEGVFVDANGKNSAIMNGEVVFEGSTVNSIKVDKIYNDSADIIVNGQKKNIKIKQNEGVSSPEKVEKKEKNLIGVGDATLTYASYSFELPPDWVPAMDDNTILVLNQKKGFWRGMHRNGAVILISPTRMKEGAGHSEFIKQSKDLAVLNGCSIKGHSFAPSFAYPYEAYLEHCPKINRYGLIVFAKLPTHVISFNLYAPGEDENCLIPSLEDFNKVIASFKWTLQLSKEIPLSTDIEQKKGSLVIVGDATLTYASYFFLLPANWIPLMDNMQATDKTGYWHGKHKDSQILIEIGPIKKQKGTTLANIANLAKDYSERESPSGSWQESSFFKPAINYSYGAYTFNNPKKGNYELFVLVEISPEYVINFIMTGYGKDEKCITPYLGDLNSIISSFRWTLGLSDEEIGNMLKKM